MKVARLTRQYAINRKARGAITGWKADLTKPNTSTNRFASYFFDSKGRRMWMHQKLIPKDSNLAEKLGIQKGARVSFFASFYGDWARALSKETVLSATDASGEMKSFVRGRKYKIPFHAIPAQSYPRIKNVYDWSISFEPIPLIDYGGMDLTAIRGLLNKKGMKLIVPSKIGIESVNEINFFNSLKTVARVYDVVLSKEKVEINSSYSYGEKAGAHGFSIQTILTNPKAKEKAYQDLLLINGIEKGKAKTETELIRYGNKIGLSEAQVMESLERIGKLSGIL